MASINLIFLTLFCLLLLGLSFLAVLYLAHPLFSSVPFLPTRKKALAEIVSNFNMKSGDILYELGCGDARVLIEAARQYSDASFIGYEISPIAYLFAKARLFLFYHGQSNISVRFGNFLSADLSPATHVFGYLFPFMVDNLLPKCEKELKKGSLFMSLQFPLSENLGKKPKKVIQLVQKNKLNSMLYVYEF